MSDSSPKAMNQGAGNAMAATFITIKKTAIMWYTQFLRKEDEGSGLHSALTWDTHRTKSRQTASSGNNKCANLPSKILTPKAQLSWGTTAPGKFSVLLHLAGLGSSAG